ncbi:MAG TPA: LUD domain-containing protein [Fimbriimonadaceae bacterium]|nr:LUD domain-containing protein [Fimbriimonadaceae bacterium]
MSRVNDFAKTLDDQTTKSVRAASAAKVAARRDALAKAFDDPEDARAEAHQIKDFVLDNLDTLLTELEKNCRKNGIQIHHAKDANEANAIVLQICQRVSPPPTPSPRTDIVERGLNQPIIVKGKSMATEEIHLNQHLINAGYEVVETDLGEFVVQLDGDTPSHIITPIIHKNRKQIADTFSREGLGEYTEVPESLTMQARAHLRSKFRDASVGISGVNFAIAESGRLAIVENEGNNRLCTTVPPVHIAVMGIEKILPKEEDLALFIPLLTGSATGQAISTYVHLIRGPRQPEEPDGPNEVHLILLDNGRRKVLDGPYRDILRCIRCGACLNVCPVYRQASGHGYGHVYSGPLGAVLAPALEGVKVMGDLAKASSLCGACEEVCPVRIPIPRMLLELRNEGENGSWKGFATATTHPSLWGIGLKLLPMASTIPVGGLRKWTEFREPPKRIGRPFRSWWQGRPENPLSTMFVRGEGAGGGETSSRPDDISHREEPRPWDQFKANLEALGGRIISKDEYDQILTRPHFRDPILGESTAGLWDAEVGISLAHAAIAKTGTLVMSSSPETTRLSSVVPKQNLVIVDRAAMFTDLKKAIPHLPKTNVGLISGPSRTADIEGVMVRGVHGPGELLVFVRDP